MNYKNLILAISVILILSCDTPQDEIIQNTGIAAELSGLRWEIPVITTQPNYRYSCTDPVTQEVQLTGEPEKIYNVTIRFRGIIETRPYTNGTSRGYWVVGGGYSTSNTFNVYSLSVSDPMQTYYLNFGESVSNCFVVDYTQTIPVSAGALVRLSLKTLDNKSIEAVDVNGNRLTCPGVENIGAGQFMQMDVISISEN